MLLEFYNITSCKWDVDFENDIWSNILLLTRNFYVCKDPFFMAVMASLFVAIFAWLLSVITQNHSQIDRLWTILPEIYTWHFALYDCLKDLSTCNLGCLNARGVIMSILATLWGVRLSYNFMRKGGYSWNVWSIGDSAPLNILDLVCCVLFLGFWIGEFIADEQQWNFQTEKRKLIAASSSKTVPMILESNYSLGFLTNGLFRYSRHPNYFCEMGLWWTFYVFSIAAGGNDWLFNWSIIGAMNLTILMCASTIFTENISKKKYPLYKKYQKTTSILIPWFPVPISVSKQSLRKAYNITIAQLSSTFLEKMQSNEG
ncbi:12083_t:CDS:2 [Cetraspora pellucida]|uniref:12083_t:CDS:1 n=1 Tax=Cetraspora pellucida TaxID=1433469 RepID=A0A9N9H7I3_9GLOM|nr:12083_t:CDS:2 [Cetraspora pellucida]